jgi:predicted Fe-Mo cluster-binding NifX family protein
MPTAPETTPCYGEELLGPINLVFASETPRGLDSDVGAWFEECSSVVLVHVEYGTVISTHRVSIPRHGTAQTTSIMPLFMHVIGADFVVAGSMTTEFADACYAHGMDVATGIDGPVREAVDDWLHGELHADP